MHMASKTSLNRIPAEHNYALMTGNPPFSDIFDMVLVPVVRRSFSFWQHLAHYHVLVVGSAVSFQLTDVAPAQQLSSQMLNLMSLRFVGRCSNQMLLGSRFGVSLALIRILVSKALSLNTFISLEPPQGMHTIPALAQT